MTRTLENPEEQLKSHYGFELYGLFQEPLNRDGEGGRSSDHERGRSPQTTLGYLVGGRTEDEH